MSDICERLGVDAEAPRTFDGIPTTNPQNAWLFSFAHSRGDAIEDLWDLWEAGLAWADNPSNAQLQENFRDAFSTALPQANWTLCTALFRARPNFFPPMDKLTRRLAAERLGIKMGDYWEAEAPGRYLEVMRKLDKFLNDEASPVHSIPEFSEAAWLPSTADETVPEESEEDLTLGGTPAPNVASFPDEAEKVSYTIEDLVNDGCFVEKDELERIVAALRQKKNVILQGAPGTGKTWLAKRLGWVLAGYKSGDEVAVVQFHPNTSYEDFVRGYRPVADDSGNAGLRLVDGPFLRLAEKARELPGTPHTMVVEEINRGNPARALGEMLTLLEAGKRNASEAIRLTYERHDQDGAGVWLPENLHLIGTMNVADRSLALVDLALRRRFAFVTLQPAFTAAWKQWTSDRLGDAALVDDLEAAAAALNERISSDSTLGRDFVVGHSYFTPDGDVRDATTWLREKVERELEPLLREYWFDNQVEADEALEPFKQLIDRD